jgi:hypothetical protein
MGGEKVRVRGQEDGEVAKNKGNGEDAENRGQSGKRQFTAQPQSNEAPSKLPEGESDNRQRVSKFPMGTPWAVRRQDVVDVTVSVGARPVPNTSTFEHETTERSHEGHGTHCGEKYQEDDVEFRFGIHEFFRRL